MIQDKNRVINTKKGKGKLPLFCSIAEMVILIYGLHHIILEFIIFCKACFK